MAALAALSNPVAHPSAAGFAAAASYAGGKPINISPDALLGKALSTKVNGNAVVTGAGETDESKATQFDGCATCKTRKYVDRSNESDVSFQSASHISPSASAAVVSCTSVSMWQMPYKKRANPVPNLFPQRCASLPPFVRNVADVM